jgi:hypothetical protein
MKNLAADPAYQDQLKQMQTALADWQEEIHDYGMEPDSEALEKAFEGYGVESIAKNGKKIEKLEAEVRQKVEETQQQ